MSFGSGKRTIWNRSLSIRARESIVVAARVNLGRQPKQRGVPRKPKQGPRAKKVGQEPPDFTKEKAYFQEVDSFELLEESPSAKHFGTWVMGTKQDIVVHDLPAILERWRISKLASRYGSSQPLFKIVETPLIPSGQSNCSGSNALIEKTPERASWSRVPVNFTSYQRIITPQPAYNDLNADLNENGILESFDALRIKDEGILSDISENVEALK